MFTLFETLLSLIERSAKNATMPAPRPSALAVVFPSIVLPVTMTFALARPVMAPPRALFPDVLFAETTELVIVSVEPT